MKNQNKDKDLKKSAGKFSEFTWENVDRTPKITGSKMLTQWWYDFFEKAYKEDVAFKVANKFYRVIKNNGEMSIVEVDEVEPV